VVTLLAAVRIAIWFWLMGLEESPFDTGLSSSVQLKQYVVIELTG